LAGASDGRTLHIGGLAAWPSELVGRHVQVTGQLGFAQLFPEAAKGPDGEWSQGVAPGSAPSAVVREATWSLLSRSEPTPWSLSLADGSGNLTRVWRDDDESPPRWSYAPITPEQSSSGTYSGGAPASGLLNADAAADLWCRARGVASAPGVQATTRSMGTGRLTWKSPGGDSSLNVEQGAALIELEAAFRALRER